MHLEPLVADLALILVASAVVTIIFKKLKQPVVLGYIVAGFLISPNFDYLPTVVDQEDISTWADLGVIFLMFGLGLEFSFKKLAQVGGSAFTVATTVMAMMMLVDEMESMQPRKIHSIEPNPSNLPTELPMRNMMTSSVNAVIAPVAPTFFNFLILNSNPRPNIRKMTPRSAHVEISSCATTVGR